MCKRIITGIVAAMVLIPFLIFSGTWAFVFFIWAISLLGVYEMLGCIGVRRNLFAAIPAYALAIALPLAARFVPGDEHFFVLTLFFSFGYMMYLMAVSVFSGEKYTISDAAMTFMTVFYILFGFSSIILLRDMLLGGYIFLLIFIIPWSCDTFAYFTGMALGKHKLIESVSPKKTVEGAIGGVIGAVAITLLYGFLVGTFTRYIPNYLALGITALVCSVVSQCGDLIASLIKRKYGVKDYGFILPGHGGILDRFDSILAVAPIMLILSSLSSFFTFFTW